MRRRRTDSSTASIAKAGRGSSELQFESVAVLWQFWSAVERVSTAGRQSKTFVTCDERHVAQSANISGSTITTDQHLPCGPQPRVGGLDKGNPRHSHVDIFICGRCCCCLPQARRCPSWCL